MLHVKYGTRYITMRIDKINFSSQYGSFLNYATISDDIVVTTASLANGATRNITVTIPYTRGGTVADIYATRASIKTFVSTGGRAAASAIYNFKSTETASFNILYSSSNITVTLSITNNSGSAINPNAQTIKISVVQYDAPIISI